MIHLAAGKPVIDARITVHCDGQADCPSIFWHTVNLDGLSDPKAYEALQGGHQAARAAAIVHGWRPGADPEVRTLLCRTCPDPASLGVPTEKELAAEVEQLIASALQVAHPDLAEVTA